MSDYVNWIDFFNLNKDQVAQQMEEQRALEAQQSASDASVLQGLRDQYSSDSVLAGPNGAQPKMADYSAYQDLMQQQQRRQQAASAMSSNRTYVDDLLGVSRGGDGGQVLGAQLGELNKWSQAQADASKRGWAESSARQKEREAKARADEIDRRNRQAERDRAAWQERNQFNTAYNTLYAGGRGREDALRFARNYYDKRDVRKANKQISNTFSAQYGSFGGK